MVFVHNTYPVKCEHAGSELSSRTIHLLLLTVIHNYCEQFIIIAAMSPYSQTSFVVIITFQYNRQCLRGLTLNH